MSPKRQSGSSGYTPEFQELETFTRRVLRKVLVLNEAAVKNVTAALITLARARFREEDIKRWAEWKAHQVADQAGISNPAGVYIKALRTETPDDMPKPKNPAPATPDGHSPAPNFLNEVRSNAEACEDEWPTPLILIWARGRRTQDFHAARIEVNAEAQLQGWPKPWDLDLTKFQEGEALECDPVLFEDFKSWAASEAKIHAGLNCTEPKDGEMSWQMRRKLEWDEIDRRHGKRRHPRSISEPITPEWHKHNDAEWERIQRGDPPK